MEIDVKDFVFPSVLEIQEMVIGLLRSFSLLHAIKQVLFK